MKKYLNHELVLFKTKCQIKDPEDFIGYKCIKCNKIINWSIDHYSDNNSLAWHWMFNDGMDYEPLYNSGSWHWLELTCEEEQIKTLLE